MSRSTVTTGWLGNRLMRSEVSGTEPFEQQICLLRSNTDFPCERPVASEPGREIWDPAASPSGRFIAAVSAPLDDVRGPIAVYDGASGRRLRTLTRGRTGATPSWSRDGKRIAFAGGGSIYVVRATGGRPRRVVKGVQPVWVPG